MACDGKIVPEEIQELKIIEKNTPFFKEIDLSDELEFLKKELEEKGVQIVEDLFNSLKESDLNPIRELIILEVALRIIAADREYDENEIKFVNLLRANLKIHDEWIIDRFGKIDILHTSDYSRNIRSKGSESDFIENLHFPEIGNIEEIDLNNVQDVSL